MRRFDHTAAEIIIRHHGAAHRRNADSFPLYAQLIQTFRHKAVDNAVRATRAVMRRDIQQCMGPFICSSHY